MEKNCCHKLQNKMKIVSQTGFRKVRNAIGLSQGFQLITFSFSKVHCVLQVNAIHQLKENNAERSFNKIYEHYAADAQNTLQKLLDTGPSFSEAVNSCITFSSPLLMTCISSAKYFNCICLKMKLQILATKIYDTEN